jgi:hypothetical protein
VAELVLDDTQWSAVTLSQEVLVAGIESLLERLRIAHDRGESVTTCAEYFSIICSPGVTVLDLMYDETLLSKDLRLELIRRLDKAHRIPDADLEHLEVEFAGGASVFSPSLAWAHALLGARRAVGCLTPTFSLRRGPIVVFVCDVPRFVHFLPDEMSHVTFFRHAIELEGGDEGALRRLASSAFPRLRWATDVFRGLRDFSRPFVDMRDDLVRVFSVLSDHGASVFALRVEKDVVAQFAGLGLTISTETRETLLDEVCRTAREGSYKGCVLVFDWHVKIQPHIDRVHIHPGVPESDDCIVVGVMHRHLPLP